MTFTTAVVLVLLVCFLSSTPVKAQDITISCTVVPNGSCNDPIQADGELQSRNMIWKVTKNTRPVAGVLVRFRALGGSILPDSILTDANGLVSASWSRSKDSSTAAILVSAMSSSGSVSYVLPMIPKSAGEGSKLVLENWTHTRSWFEKNQLPNRIPLAIKEMGKAAGRTVHIKDADTCHSQKVVFLGNSRAGTATPDTVEGELYPINNGHIKGRKKPRGVVQLTSIDPAAADTIGCFVYTNWTLGENPGPKELRAKIVPKGYDAPYTLRIDGNARALPRFVAGFAVSRSKGYLGLKKGGTSTIHVERLSSDGAKLNYDSSVTAPNSVDTVKAKYGASAIAGLSIALPLWRLGKFDRLSFTGGVDMANPRDDFYAGGSLARLFGSSVEALPLDIHALLHFGRQEFLKDPTACAGGLNCKTKKRMRIQGPAFMLSADATTLISEVIKRLVP